MELKDLHRVPFISGTTLLTDRPTRRLAKRMGNGVEVSKVHFRGISLHEAKDREEEEKRRYSGSRDSVLEVVKVLATRGIHGLEFTSDQPLRIWWFRSSSWKVTNLRRFLKSRAFRSNPQARSQVTISWPMDVLGEEELRKIEAVLGPDFINDAKVSIKKDTFQGHSGAKRLPVGTKETDGKWSIKTDEQWDDEDEEGEKEQD